MADAAGLLARWRAALAGGADDPDLPVALGPALDGVALRDAVMLAAVPGSGTAAEAVLDDRSPIDLDRLLAAPPAAALLARARQLLAEAARACPGGRASRSTGRARLAAWLAGDGVRPRLLADRAEADQPGHRLAGLVARLLAAGVPPPWAASTQTGPP